MNKTLTWIFIMIMLSLNAHATDKKEFEKKFTPLRDEILDEGGYFSFSEMTHQLRLLFPLADKIGKNSQERFELYDIYSLVLSKKEDASPEVIKITEKILKEFKTSPLLTSEKKMRFYFRLANGYDYEEKYSEAIKYQKLFLSLAKNEPLVSKEQYLGQEEQLAYLYHENKEYKKALECNLNIEKEALIHRIPDNKFFNLHNNIAQNYYKLHDFKQAKVYLNKRLKNAQTSKNITIELDTLFQLAVLAFEEGENEQAKKIFTQRVTLAKENKLDKDTVNRAKEDLEIYFNKIKNKTK